MKNKIKCTLLMLAFLLVPVLIFVVHKKSVSTHSDVSESPDSLIRSQIIYQLARVDSIVKGIIVIDDATGLDVVISPYDGIFKKHSRAINWDWRLLAAMSWTESRFNINAVSYMGAKGLMQMMPVTASRFGLNEVTVLDPDLCVEAAVKYIRYLDRMFFRIENREERAKFIMASYNAGPGHVLDAMALAEKYRYNKYVWDDSVEKFLYLKRNKRYYKDPLCKSGRFRANHTLKFVNTIFNKYEEFCNKNNNL